LKYWWVNQSQSYQAERRAGVLWAPLRSKTGVRLKHWEAMAHAQPGDQILHYADGFVRAISTVTAKAVLAPRPASLPPDLWGRDGRLLTVRYRDAVRPVSLLAIPDRRRRLETVDGPFQGSNLKVKIGYLWPLSQSFAQWFVAEHGKHFKTDTPPRPASTPHAHVAPSPPLPAEATDSARELLQRLIGEPLKTVNGSPNQILQVTGTHAVVGTDRAPQGQPVPIALIAQALDQLARHGFVTLDVKEVGYRSAFIGAVLLTLPGAIAAGSPPKITINIRDDDSDRTITYEGDLSRPRTAEERREQVQLRRELINSRSTAPCALCGHTYPVRFLWAAHIKKRSVCSSEEKRDLSNIAMLACLFGCDTLFEMGYIGVDGSGTLIASLKAAGSLLRHIEPLNGRTIANHREATAIYFSWHLSNTFRGEKQASSAVAGAGSP
jgi:hypothetical protein